MARTENSLRGRVIEEFLRVYFYRFVDPVAIREVAIKSYTPLKRVAETTQLISILLRWRPLNCITTFLESLSGWRQRTEAWANFTEVHGLLLLSSPTIKAPSKAKWSLFTDRVEATNVKWVELRAAKFISPQKRQTRSNQPPKITASSDDSFKLR